MSVFTIEQRVAVEQLRYLIKDFASHPENGIKIVDLIGNPMTMNPMFKNPVFSGLKTAVGLSVDGKSIGQIGVEGVKELATKTDDALRAIDFPGIPPADPTPPGMEWQPTIIVSPDGKSFSQGPSHLVPEGTKSPNNQYYDPNGNRIYPPDGGWAHPTDPNKRIPEPAPHIPEKPPIDPNTKTNYDNSQNFQPRRDPLTLDLDGDGLETTGAGIFNPIYFDHDGDGIKNGSGWVKPDDAFLVLDKNGNGTIDNGRELFGDSTIKSNGQTAVDGFDALADLDSVANGGNGDGIVNASDTQFANLRIWRDLNQDGISQEGELFTLDSQNIVGINIAKTANNQTLTNGNQIADTGSFIKGDGSTGTVGEVTGNMADLNLADDTFHRIFPNALDTTTVASLPDMQGSGAVRDLREAANDKEWRVAA